MPSKLEHYPSFQDVCNAVGVIEAVGISYEDATISTSPSGQTKIGIPKELVFSSDPDEVTIMSAAVAITEGENQVTKDPNGKGDEIALDARLIINFFEEMKSGKIELFPPITVHQQSRVNNVQQRIVDLAINTISQ